MADVIRAIHVPIRSMYFASVQSFEYKEVSLNTTDQPMNLFMEGLEKSGKKREKSGKSFPFREVFKGGSEGLYLSQSSQESRVLSQSTQGTRRKIVFCLFRNGTNKRPPFMNLSVISVSSSEAGER
jgi:hypothetical protein